MINAISFLEKNPEMITLLIERKISLLGTTMEEMEALIKVFREDIIISPSYYWRIV